MKKLLVLRMGANDLNLGLLLAKGLENMACQNLNGMPIFQIFEQIKKFLETNYPRGRAIEVFRSFHFDLKVQKRNFFITPHPKLLEKVLDSP